jgi:hypothetical protein
MNIAIDLDGTIDKLGVHVVRCILSACDLAGFRTFLVTSRSVEDKSLCQSWALLANINEHHVICTNGEAKRWHCEKRGLKIDVWIDDDPSSIINGK